MATLHITVPNEVKTRFEQAFYGQSLDELVTRLMREAVERKPAQNAAENPATIWDFILNRPYEGTRKKEDIDAQIRLERARAKGAIAKHIAPNINLCHTAQSQL